MDDTEHYVRLALADDFAKRARDIYCDSEQTSEIKMILENSVNKSLSELVDSGDVSESEAHNMREGILSVVENNLDANTIYQRASGTWMRGKSDYQAEFDMIRNMAKLAGEELPQEVNSFYDFAMDFIQRRDNIVADLVEKVRALPEQGQPYTH